MPRLVHGLFHAGGWHEHRSEAVDEEVDVQKSGYLLGILIGVALLVPEFAWALPVRAQRARSGQLRTLDTDRAMFSESAVRVQNIGRARGVAQIQKNHAGVLNPFSGMKGASVVTFSCPLDPKPERVQHGIGPVT